jgi:GMP synthase (glutamine-hydrolysing)
MSSTLRDSRNVIVLQHAASENLGTIEDALTACGVAFEYVRSFEGQPVPSGVDGASGLIVMGGPMGVYETDKFPFLRQEMNLMEAFLKAERPILGVCLGSQLLAAVLGAPVKKGRAKEIGWFPVRLAPASAADALWKDQPSPIVAYHWHGDIFDLPKGAVALASSDITPLQSYRFGDRAYGILFHLEVTETHIRKMLDEFAGEIRQEKLSASEILKKSEAFLPPLQKVGASVFGRWIDLGSTG